MFTLRLTLSEPGSHELGDCLDVGQIIATPIALILAGYAYGDHTRENAGFVKCLRRVGPAAVGTTCLCVGALMGGIYFGLRNWNLMSTEKIHSIASVAIGCPTIIYGMVKIMSYTDLLPRGL